MAETPDQGAARAAFLAALALSVAGTELADVVTVAWEPDVGVPDTVANPVLPLAQRLDPGASARLALRDVALFDGDPAAPFTAAWGVNVLVSAPDDAGGADATLAGLLATGWNAQPRRARPLSPWTLAAFPDAAVPYVRELPGDGVAVRLLLAPPLHPRRTWA